MSTHQLRVGVIGLGAMGADHVRTLTTWVPAARVTRVFDVDQGRARSVADRVGATASASADELVRDDAVDAVVIASPDRTHADLAVACVSAGKPVLCEKPLSVTAEDARRVVEAELAAGRRSLRLGFMRRYDPALVELQELVSGGRLGAVRVVHAVHRNASSSTSTDSAGIVSGSMVHELDTIPWLLGDELSAVRVESPVRTGLRDPQLATLWTRGGVMATVEVFVNARYGYDVRCEVVGDRATASLAPRGRVQTLVDGTRGGAVDGDFVGHFADAYRIELAGWVRSVLAGTTDGPSAWDGYVAAVAVRAGVASLDSGVAEPVDPGPRPDLYR